MTVNGFMFWHMNESHHGQPPCGLQVSLVDEEFRFPRRRAKMRMGTLFNIYCKRKLHTHPTKNADGNFFHGFLSCNSSTTYMLLTLSKRHFIILHIHLIYIGQFISRSLRYKLKLASWRCKAPLLYSPGNWGL